MSSAAAVLAVATLASRFAGIIRDRLLSGAFGAGTELDAYYAAFRTPDFIYNLFVLGAITAGFIPVFTAYLAKEDARVAPLWGPPDSAQRDASTGGGESGDRTRAINTQASELASLLLTILGVSLTVLAALGVLAAPAVVHVLTPGFGGAERQLTVTLTRIMFLSPIFLGLSSVLGGILQTKRRFFVYALAPILYNVGIIFGTVALAPTMGITGVAIGVVVGAFLHFLAQVVACRGLGFRYRFAWNTAHEGVREIGRLTVPRTAGLAVAQVNLMILTGIASTLGAGGIAVFNLANNLQNFPVGIIGVSFAVAAFPLISELAAKNQQREFVAALGKTVRSLLFLIVPTTVAFLLLRAQIVRVILGTGRFDWQDTVATADTLAFFTVSLFAQALYPLVVRAFFAFHDVKTPLLTAIVAVLAERSLAWYLVGKGMGPAGLALAFSIGSIIDLALLWMLLRRRTAGLAEGAIFRSLARTTAAGLLMAGAMQGTKAAVAGIVDMRTFAGIFAQGASAAVVGVAVFLGAAYLLGSEEAKGIVRLYGRKTMPVPASNIIQEDGALNVEERL